MNSGKIWTIASPLNSFSHGELQAEEPNQSSQELSSGLRVETELLWAFVSRSVSWGPTALASFGDFLEIQTLQLTPDPSNP